MTGGWGRKSAAGIASATAIGVAAGLAAAQDGSGVSVTAGISSSLTIDDNRGLAANSPGTTYQFDNRLSLDVVSETPTTRLSFGVVGNLRLEDVPSGTNDNGFDDPVFNFGYRLEMPDSEVTASLRYRQQRVEDTFLTDLDGDFLEDDLVSDTGDQEDIRATLGLRFGIDAPVGGDLTLSRRERDYTDVLNVAELFDRTTDSARGTVRFRFSPLATGRLIGSWSEYDADDPELTNRITTGFGAGLAYELTPALRFDGEIVDTEIETTETVGFVTTTVTETGYSGFASLTRDMPNGNIVLSARSTVSSVTSRNTFFASRSLETPGASLSFGLGVTDSDTADDATIIGRLSYARELPTGVLTANLNQVAATNNDDEEVLRTTLELGYLHELNEATTLDFGLLFAQTDDIGIGSVNEDSRTEFTVSYRREVTEDWDWSLGYRARFEDNAGGSDGRSNAIITTFDRRFSLR